MLAKCWEVVCGPAAMWDGEERDSSGRDGRGGIGCRVIEVVVFTDNGGEWGVEKMFGVLKFRALCLHR